VLVLPEPRLAIVQIQLLVPGGSASDPRGQEGLASLTAQMLRHGTTSRSADDFAAAVEALGGSVSASTSAGYSVLSGSFLARDLEAGLELMSSAAIDPIFPEDELLRVRAQVHRTLVQERADVAATADEKALETAFSGQPCAHPVLGTTRSLGALTRDAVRAYYRDAWRPDGALLAIAGDVTPERGFALAADWFGRWVGHSAIATAGPAPLPSPAPRLALLDLPGLGWAEIRMALVLPNRRDGGEAATLAAGAFAAAPTSRLATRQGGIGGGMPRGSLSSVGQARLLMVSAAVPVDSAAAAVTELAPLRRLLAATFPLGFETLAGALAQWQSAQFEGLTADELMGTPGRIAATTADQVADVTRRWLDPGHAVVLVAGPADRLRAGLAGLGAIEDTALEPITAFTALAGHDTLAVATPERVAHARQVVARALEAHGGLAALRGIRDSEIKGQTMLGSPAGDVPAAIDQVRKEPYRLLSVVQVLMRESRQVLNGSRGWFQASVDSLGTPLDSLALIGLRALFTADLPHVLLAAADSGATVIWAGTSRSGTGETDDVEVFTVERERRRYHFDRDSGLLTQIDWFESPAPQAQVVLQKTFSDYRVVDGIRWPFREENRGQGDNARRLDVSSVRLNQGIGDATFDRPRPRP
jgi:predicted Zn-dependent peptidase